MEDNFNERQPECKTNSMEDDLTGKQSQWKTISLEDDIKVSLTGSS